MFKKLIASALLAVLVSGQLFADLKTYGNLDEAFAIAKAENKAVALTVVSTNCPWCHKPIKQTIKEKRVEETLSKNFIYVVLNKDVDQIPDGYKTRMVPTTFFMDKNGQKTAQSAVGFWEADDFLSYLGDAKKKTKK